MWKGNVANCRQVQMLISSLVTSDRTPGYRMKPGQGRFWKDIRKRHFTQRLFGPWNGLPREVVTAPSLRDFKKYFSEALRHMVWLLGLSWAEPRAGLDVLMGPFQLRMFYDLIFLSLVFSQCKTQKYCRWDLHARAVLPGSYITRKSFQIPKFNWNWSSHPTINCMGDSTLEEWNSMYLFLSVLSWARICFATE